MNLFRLFKQNSIYDLILKQKKDNNLCSGYLFCLEDEYISNFFSSFVAKIILGDDENCAVCAMIDKNTHPDVSIYPKGNNFSVDDVKEIIKIASLTPAISDKKVIIINKIENGSEQAQNKLLKTLETPPKDVIFIVTCCNEQGILPTIKSRLNKFDVKLDANSFFADFTEEYKKHKLFEVAAESCGGNIGAFLKILNSTDFLDAYNIALDVVFSLKNSGQIVGFMQTKLNLDKYVQILTSLQQIFNNFLYFKLDCLKFIKNKKLVERFESVQNDYSLNSLTGILNYLDLCAKMNQSNVSVNNSFEMLLLKILEVKHLCK